MMSDQDPIKFCDGITRFLFVTPSRMPGSCDGLGFELTFAYPSWSRRFSGLPFPERPSYSILSVRTQTWDQESILKPTFEWVGDEISALLSAYFGKLILNCGFFQLGDLAGVPQNVALPPQDIKRAPFNDQARKPLGVDVNLQHAKPAIDAYFNSQGEEETGIILQASEFYRIALENFHTRPEISLTLFCSAIESLLPLKSYSDAELYDEELLQTFAQIEKDIENGERIVRKLKGRLFQIKRKIATFVDHYVPIEFFQHREFASNSLIKDRADLITRVRAVYDLRSLVLHAGSRKGLWYIQSDGGGGEIGQGVPVLSNRKLQKTLTGGMTLTGLERVTSTVLRSVINEWIGRTASGIS